MGILIDTVRIANFRAIKNLEVNLSVLTLLVGANNAGKTTFLKALNLALGIDRRMISRDDFHDDGKQNPDELEILIDVRIIAVDNQRKRQHEFDNLWSDNSLSGRINIDDNDFQFVSFRTKCKFDSLKQGYTIEAKELKRWEDFSNWQDLKNEGTVIGRFDTIPLIFIDAQRDIQSDLKDRFSYLGKLTDKPNIPKVEKDTLEQKLNELNNDIVAKSDTLSHLRIKLLELNKTVNAQGTGVEISPINKSIRDIGRNLNINFQDTNTQSFPLENHGMGTRSWASLLTLKAYISWQEEARKKKNEPYCPILALEEPEAHLHPNAQRQLFHQLSSINGQKIISTHSPFIAAQCDLEDLRHFYKVGNELKVGQITIVSETELSEIKELNNELGKKTVDPNLKKENQLRIKQLKIKFASQLDRGQARKVRREVMHTRGELLFAKVLVLFEGETEEQALPILAKEKYGFYPFELGICFISVGGKLNYEPFLTVAKLMNIPVYIFSDGDGNTKNEVKAQIKTVFQSVDETKLFVLDKTDFEEYLVINGLENEVRNAINIVRQKDDYINSIYIPKLHGTPLKKGSIRDYKSQGGDKRALVDCLRESKTEFAPIVAEQIVNKKDENGKCVLPPAIDELFNKIAKDQNIEIK